MTWEVPGYVADELIGTGGSAEVWRGRDSATGEVVALKRLRADRGVGSGAEDVARLTREAVLLGRFSDPDLIRLRAVIDEPAGPVLVLDHAAGGSLAALLDRRGRLSPEDVVAALAPMADVLAHAHACGLVHGDVSPANVVLTADGRPVLADLGTARLTGDPPTVLRGTEGFLDPRVAAGAQPSPASDVFALGAVAAFALTGCRVGGVPDCAGAFRAAAAAEGLRGPLVTAILSTLRVDPASRPTAAVLATAWRAAAATLLETGLPGPVVRLAEPNAADARCDARGSARAVRATGPTGHSPTRVDTGRHRDRSPVARRLRGPVRPIARGAVLGAVGLALAVGGGLAWGAGSPAERSAPVAGPAPTSTSRQSAPAPHRSSVPEESAPVDWSEALDTLYARRAAAVRAADPTLLEGVYAPASPVRSADAALLADLRARHARVDGFAPRVLSVRLVTRSRTTARLAVMDELPGYRVTSAAGSVLGNRPGRGPESRTVELAQVDGRWRISSVSAPTR